MIIIINYHFFKGNRIDEKSDLKERIKELKLLYEVSSLIIEVDKSEAEIIRQIVKKIPPACQDPENTYARIVLEENEFCSPGFKKTEVKHDISLEIENDKQGWLEVYLDEENTFLKEDFFLKLEKEMLASVAHYLVNFLAYHRSQQELEYNQLLLEKSQEIAKVGSWEINLENHEINWTRQVYEIFGVEPTEFEPTFEKVLEFIHPEDRSRLKESYFKSIRENRSELKLEHRIICNNSQKIRHVVQKFEHLRDEQGEIIGSIGMIQDITKQKKREERLLYLSTHDQLTGLYNRKFLQNNWSQVMKSENLPLGIILIDINGLRMVNDTYGNKQGDNLLKQLAEIIKSVIEEENIALRWGGDEFLILLPKSDRNQLKEKAAQIEQKCHQAESKGIPLSVALGISIKREEGEQFSEILHRADKKMAQNKLTVSQSKKSSLVRSLLNTLVAKSHETKEHAIRMTRLARALGEKFDLPEKKLNDLALVATLHDIGKTSLPEEILKKSGDLTEKEWEEVKKHPQYGYNIARATEEVSHVAEAILSHHEWWDGSGYPQGLSGEEIPLLARIVALVDAYDVMTHERPYKPAFSKKYAHREIKEGAGSQFDPKLVEEFLVLLSERE